MRDMTHSDVSHDSFRCVTWLVHMCDMTHSWLVHMCDMTHSDVSHDSIACVTWLIQMCDMTHSDVWHDSFICVTWRIHPCDMTHIYVRHNSIMLLVKMWDMTHLYAATASRIRRIHPYGGVRRIYTCAMTHLYYSSTCGTWLIYMLRLPHVRVGDINMVEVDAFIRVTWLIHICVCDITHSHMWHASFRITHPHGHDTFI